jgi:hypothetical protein
VSLSVSTTTCLSGVEQQGLDAGRMMIYRCRVEELDKVGALIPPEGGLAEDGGGNKSVRGGARSEFVGPVVLLACYWGS